MEDSNQSESKGFQMEAETYEVLRNRLRKSGEDLRLRLSRLNEERKKVFGTIETRLITTDRINTDNNCVSQDMIPVGNHFIFGYNVHLGLKSNVEISDVFSIYHYHDQSFHNTDNSLIQDAAFHDDFKKLYKYYKETQFIKFTLQGNILYMIFRIGKNMSDIKAFKWIFQGDKIKYVDNRSEHEYKLPDQFEFRWKKSTRDQHKQGIHPHISIEDRLFVETIGGDLTIKIEDNTNEGKGIYKEPVENRDQTLDDSDIQYAFVGNLILLKIKPYLENNYRYLVFNAKLNEVKRVDTIKDACVLLPDNQGILFPNGYYLQTGDFKIFEFEQKNLVFEKRIISPNGEDFLYVFFHKETGEYLLLPYNLIAQKIENPIFCHGFSIFDNGCMCFFKTDHEATKHHAIQIWQTPFVGPNFQWKQTEDSYLYKIGNKDIVRAMAEAQELLTLIHKDDSYAGLYHDLSKNSTTILDSYHWLNQAEAFQLEIPLKEMRHTAVTAIDEFEKVISIKANTEKQIADILGQADDLKKKVKLKKAAHILDFISLLADIRRINGSVISLKDLRYADLEKIISYEQELIQFNDEISGKCVKFLLKEDALKPYHEKVKELHAAIEATQKVIEINSTTLEANTTSKELEMLIEIVSNLKIEDATETTRIIDNISAIYSNFNQIRAAINVKKRDLLLKEGKAEFNAQLKLIDQGVINYLDVCDTPEKCEEYLTRLMVQLEELEGKFSEFTEYLDQLSEKREEIYNAFESKKINLLEARNQRANTLQNAAERILKSIQARISRFKDEIEINGYFASDLMVGKLRDIINELIAQEDSVKADDLQSKLKTLREDTIRQLKDKNDLYVDGENIIRFGSHQFSVNTQNLALTLINKEGTLYYHLTGTNFFEEVDHPGLNELKSYWEQSLLSENQNVYRSEYLVYKILTGAIEGTLEDKVSVLNLQKLTFEELTRYVQQFMSVRFNEGYIKGVHDHDAALILASLVTIYQNADLLRYNSAARACARLYWITKVPGNKKDILNHQLKGAGYILQVFPDTKEFEGIRSSLEIGIRSFIEENSFFPGSLVSEAEEFLFYELSRGDHFVISHEAATLHEAFIKYLKKQKVWENYVTSLKALQEDLQNGYLMIRNWLRAYISTENLTSMAYFDEAAVLLFSGGYDHQRVVHVQLSEVINGLTGIHPVIKEKKYELNLNNFLSKLKHFEAENVPGFIYYSTLKKQLSTDFAYELRLEEFKPRVMAGFVRNQLIDKVYLPLIGANLAKQIGAAGENKRTDLMGMLLLISPPGYGKTTLMEYIADRLGIIFMKINGPALGHDITSVDPSEAKNAGARQELQKLNLAFEMGDNVMIYLDDIQHCNPEFLQKFISLCDGQRKIEGVYKGRSKTYDFRGKKVCVVMAGNPYTESGEKFRIPDMLTNRADIYNLGDIIGDSEEEFKMSFLENCFTSNQTLSRLASKSRKDVHSLIHVANTGVMDGLNLENSYSTQEINDYLNVLRKLIKIRDTVLLVNKQYILSAAQAEEFRTEPPFKLQGSYRNMNKLAEKIIPLMNDTELETILMSHYENEAQTLTTGAEANLLKFKEITKRLSHEENTRWKEIKEIFLRNQKIKGMGSNHMAQVLLQIENVSNALVGIKQALNGKQNGKIKGILKDQLYGESNDLEID